jgi:hypothetical protein
VQLEHLFIDDNFNPEVGFVRRTGMRRSFGQFRFSPRPKSIPSVRKLVGMTSLAHVQNTAGRLDTRDWITEFAIERQNGDRFSVGHQSTYEFLPRPFAIAPSVVLPIGGYAYSIARAGYNFGRQRRVAGNLLLEHGDFYNGQRTLLSVSSGRIGLTPQFAVEPSASINRVNLVEGAFTARLVGSRVTYTVTPLMFVSALLQYNSITNTMATNVRLRWEYQPGSELFVVYNDQRDTLGAAFPDLTNRSFIVKVNRLFRF